MYRGKPTPLRMVFHLLASSMLTRLHDVMTCTRSVIQQFYPYFLLYIHTNQECLVCYLVCTAEIGSLLFYWLKLVKFVLIVQQGYAHMDFDWMKMSCPCTGHVCTL